MGITIAIGLALVGFLFIYLEFFAPGGILGALGGIFLFASTFLFFWNYGGSLWSILYGVALIALLVCTIRLALWKIKRSKGKNTFYTNLDQEGYQASTFDPKIIGSEGTALTNLKPSGHILIGDKRYQAVSEGGFIRKGEAILVTKGEGARFIVRRKIRK